MPLVSVITPAHNAGRFLGATIASVQAQTFPDWEMVIAENGSTDDTALVAERAADSDPRIRLLRLPAPVGPGGARNAALDAAVGRFVAFLDSDDLWLPAKLERQLAFARDRQAAFTCTAYRMIDEAGGAIRRIQVPPPTTDYRHLLRHTLIGCLTVMLDRDQVGPVRMPDLPRHEDVSLWLSILKRGFVAHGLAEDLARYRILKRSASADPLHGARSMWHIYRNVEHLGWLDAAACYVQYAFHAANKRSP